MAGREKYAVAFMITTLIFLVGIFVGAEITRIRIEALQRDLQLDVLDAQSLEVELSMLQVLEQKEHICAYIETRLPEIAKKKVETGRRFDIGDIPREQADLLSAQFTVSLGSFFIFNEIQEKECNLQKPRIVFFADESEQSRQQATVLDNVVFRLSDVNITVLTFHKRFVEDYSIVRLAYSLYNITRTPAMVVKGVKYDGFHSLDDVKDIVCGGYYGNAYVKPLCLNQPLSG